ncbi:hypothetical protein TNCV_1152251 [Trichonephila clavipes]|nr:hypothetical protein TNCV_1152251 [Trichonephila clavipes]
MKNAAKEEVSASGSNEISASGDGTWKTRGHTSRIGVCSFIGDITGKNGKSISGKNRLTDKFVRNRCLHLATGRTRDDIEKRIWQRREKKVGTGKKREGDEKSRGREK